jgi:hypothetical protein
MYYCIQIKEIMWKVRGSQAGTQTMTRVSHCIQMSHMAFVFGGRRAGEAAAPSNWDNSVLTGNPQSANKRTCTLESKLISSESRTTTVLGLDREVKAL